jgi:hypothetical protein
VFYDNQIILGGGGKERILKHFLYIFFFFRIFHTSHTHPSSESHSLMGAPHTSANSALGNKIPNFNFVSLVLVGGGGILYWCQRLEMHSVEL